MSEQLDLFKGLMPPICSDAQRCQNAHQEKCACKCENVNHGLSNRVEIAALIDFRVGSYEFKKGIVYKVPEKIIPELIKFGLIEFL